MNRLPHRANRAHLTLAAAFALAACGGAEPEQDLHDDHADAPSNRIDVPPLVRQNLGIEFVKVERRRVAATLRLPARVELLPTATNHYPAPYAGRVTLHVEPLQRVAAGDLLYTIDSHEWRERQRALGELASAIEITVARLAAMPPLLEACEQHERGLQEAQAATAEFLTALERAEAEVGGQAQKLKDTRAELARLAAQLAEAAEKHTDHETRRKELIATERSQREQFELQLAGAAASLGTTADALRAVQNGQARWRTLATVEVRATQTGVVDRIEVANGALVQRHGDVLTTVDPSGVRCRARALQSDASRLSDGLPAVVVPVSDATSHQRVPATVRIAPTGNATARTLDLFAEPTDDVGFLRPGMAVFVDITTDTTASEELAIPRACVLPDGLDRVFFRRDPKNPDRVIRVVADLGLDDGQWVAVRSGLMDGDEVVSSGAFELVLASSQQSPKGGHFHADGTWHEDH